LHDLKQCLSPALKERLLTAISLLFNTQQARRIHFLSIITTIIAYLL